MNSLDKDKTWFLVKLPNGKKELQNKWEFRVKQEIQGEIGGEGLSAEAGS